MPYRYTTNQNLEDFASGRVFYALPGIPAFPVRLASEIFQRSLAHWRNSGGTGLCNLYDPTCGGGYWLVVLAYLHWNSIASIAASDIETESTNLTQRNFTLLTPGGLENRINEIKRLLADFGKASHAGALESALRFQRDLAVRLASHNIPTKVFQANVTDTQALRQGLGSQPIDLILSDVPYGWHSKWGGYRTLQDGTPIWQMLNALAELINPRTIVVIAADKSQEISHRRYQRLERFQMGKRKIVFLQPKPGCDQSGSTGTNPSS